MQDFHPIITIQNFKRFHKKISFELSPLTILVGPNGGGKSTIIEALVFFQRTIKLLVSPDTTDFAWLNSHNFSDIASEPGDIKRIILSSTASEYHVLINEESTTSGFDLNPTLKLYYKNSNEQVIVEKLEFIAKLNDFKISIYPNKKNIYLESNILGEKLSNILNNEI